MANDTNRRPLVEMDVSRVASIGDLHQQLARALGFPKFYGNNWDAFWDAITSLVNMPQHLIVHGWRNITDHWPDDAETMAQCLHDLNTQYPANACTCELRP